MSLQERFGAELKALRRLMGDETVDSQLPQLNQIFTYTERKWLEYVDHIPGRRVRYLLVAEAPPWSESNQPPYVLDPLSQSRTLLKALRRAFLPNATKHVSPQAVLPQLAAQGWLVLDSIPFSCQYTSKLRSRDAYLELVRSCVEHYLLPKANTSGIEWSPNTRIAFSLRKNAKAVMAGTRTLRLGQHDFRLTEHMIAVSAANYPDAELLRKLYCLH